MSMVKSPEPVNTSPYVAQGHGRGNELSQDSLGYTGGPSIITELLMRGRQEGQKSEDGDVTVKQRVRVSETFKDAAPGFEDGRRGHKPRNVNGL